MGNVQGNTAVDCKSPPVSPELQPSGMQLPPLTAPVPIGPNAAEGEKSSSVKSDNAEKETDKLTSPGLFEELHKKCKEVMPEPFDGLRVAVNKGLSQHFNASHTLKLSSMPNGMNYHFGATYIGSKQTGPTESYPVILSDIDNSGNLMAQMIHRFTDRIKGKCVVQTRQKEFEMIQMDADYRGDDSTFACTLGNIDILAGSGIIVSHYLQRITKNLDIGAECCYQYGGPGQEAAVLSLAAKYSIDNWILAAQANAVGWHASYYHKGNENVAVGIDYEYNSRLQEPSCVSLGYQINIPKANVMVRGMLDTNWTVAAVFEKSLLPLPFVLCLSAMLNHEKNAGRFGFALQM